MVEVPVGSASDPSAELVVTETAPPQDVTALFGDAIAPAGDGIDVSLSAGSLVGPATVRFALPPDFDATQFIPAVVWAGEDGTPELVESSWAPGDSEVQATVTHFSIGWPIRIDVGKISDGIGDFLGSLVTGRAGAHNPVCGGEAEVRGAGLQVTSDSGDLVKWCVGREGGRTVVKVTNNWRAGSQVTFPASWTVLEYQGAGANLQALGDWLDSLSREDASTRSRLVGPGQTIVLDPGSLEAGSTGRVVAEASTASWLWTIAVTALDLLLTVFAKIARLDGNLRGADALDGLTFTKCFSDHYGQDANVLAPVRSASAAETITTATRFGLECGKDVLQDAVRGRGGILGRVGAAAVGVVAAGVGVVYGLVEALFAGIRGLIDEVGGLFESSQAGGDGYDVLLVAPPPPPPTTTAPPVVQASIPNELIQLYLNMLSYGQLAEDGVLGPQSTLALQQFQSDHGLPATGQPDQATVDALIERAGDHTYLVDGCGYEMGPRPDSFYLTCSLSSGIVDVQWRTWNAQRAQGSGTMFVRDCDAGCVNGQPTDFVVTIEAYAPERVRCGDGRPIQLFSFRVLGEGGEPMGEYGSNHYVC